MDGRDTKRIARAVAERTVRRLTREAGTGAVETRATELESCLRVIVSHALDAGRPARWEHLLALCRDLRMTRASFDALGHHLLTTLLPHRVGPDALIRVGALLTDVRVRLAPEETSPNGGPARRGRSAANDATRRYRSERVPEHLPTTPGWECTACGAEWPCATKQSQLLAEYGGASAGLAVYLGSCLVAAVQDLPTLPLARARTRFLGWLPRRRF